MVRGRPKGSVNKSKSNGADPGPKIETTTHNLKKEPLTDEQLEALTAHHVAAYEKLLATKKTADANLKNGVKVAKADGIKLADIKAYIDGGSEEGQAKLREDAGRLAKISRWRSFPLGFQFGIFAEGGEKDAPGDTEQHTKSWMFGKEDGLAGKPAKAPNLADLNEYMAGHQSGQVALASRTFGKEDGLAGKPAKAPHLADVNEYMAGWQSGQVAKMAGIKQQKAADADEFN